MHELKALLQIEATTGSQCVIVAVVSASDDVLRKFELLVWCNHRHHKEHHHHKLIRGNKSNTTPVIYPDRFPDNEKWVESVTKLIFKSHF